MVNHWWKINCQQEIGSRRKISNCSTQERNNSTKDVGINFFEEIGESKKINLINKYRILKKRVVTGVKIEYPETGNSTNKGGY